MTFHTQTLIDKINVTLQSKQNKTALKERD